MRRDLLVACWFGVLLCCWLTFFSSDAQARMDVVGISAGSIAREGGQGDEIVLTEHQIRQLIAADQNQRPVLLARMTGDIAAHVQRLDQSGHVIPERVLQAWIEVLLDRRVPAPSWVDWLDVRVAMYLDLQGRLAKLVHGRTGVDDRLIRANAAFASGDTATLVELLDADLRDCEASQGGGVSPTGGCRAAGGGGLSDRLAARALAAGLQEDVNQSVRLLLKAADMRDADEAERVSLLLTAGSASALMGIGDGLVAVAGRIRSEAEAVLARKPSDARWRRAAWVAQLWLGLVAADRRDYSAARAAFMSALDHAPALSTLSTRDRRVMWFSHYSLASLRQMTDKAEAQKHLVQALRLSREMTERRAQWPAAWLMRALSGLLAVSDNPFSALSAQEASHLQDALRALDRMASLGGDSTVALETRLMVLMRLHIGSLKRFDEAQARRSLSRDIAAVMAELQRRGDGAATGEAQALTRAFKRYEAEVMRLTGETAKALDLLSEVLEGARAPGAGLDQLEVLGIHASIAQTSMQAGQADRASKHWQQVVEGFERLAGAPGAGGDWDAPLWEGLVSLVQAQSRLSLAEQALKTHQKALELARRRAAAEAGYGEWHRREFQTWMASVDAHHQSGRSIRVVYDAAARGPGAAYGKGGYVQPAAEDLWTVRHAEGKRWQSLGDLAAAKAQLEQALQIADRALAEAGLSDEWLERAASSHDLLAEWAVAQQAKLLEASHRSAAVELSSKRGPDSRASSNSELKHWWRLHALAQVLQEVKLPDKAFESMSEARDLARRFATAAPYDQTWQEYLWFSEMGVARQWSERGDATAAEAAFSTAASVAEDLFGQDPTQERWWTFAVESLEALAQERRQLGREVDARRAQIQAEAHQSRLHSAERAREVRTQVNEQVGGVLDSLGLNSDQAAALGKKDLMARLQSAIDQLTDQARAADLDVARAEQLRRLRNALFVVRQLPDA